MSAPVWPARWLVRNSLGHRSEMAHAYAARATNGRTIILRMACGRTFATGRVVHLSGHLNVCAQCMAAVARLHS